MELTFHNIAKLLCLPALSLALASCGGGSGSSTDGGFTNPDNTINVSVRADDTTLPTNPNNEPPSLMLPFTTSVIVDVSREDSTVFQDGETTAQITVDGVTSGGISKLDDPETEENEFLTLTGQNFADIVGGQAQFFFTSFSEPGVVTLTASVNDPVSNRPIASRIQITVEGPDTSQSPVSALSFTGTFTDAVVANAATLDETGSLLPDGTFSRIVGVLATDSSGNPAPQGTPIEMFLIDAPIEGFPGTPTAPSAGEFFIAGSNGDPLEGGSRFDAVGAQFVTRGARAFDRLVLDGTQDLNQPALPDNTAQTGIRTVQTIVNENQLFIDQSGTPFNLGVDNGATVPYFVGRVQHGTIRSPAFTDASGVANTLLTYPSARVGQTAVLVACVQDKTVCTVLNTCNAEGTDCNTVYLGLSDTGERILTAEPTTLTANTANNVVTLRLRESNLTPVQNETIAYVIALPSSNTSNATVVLNGSAAINGTLTTDLNGNALANISSQSVAPGETITINFNATNVDNPAVVTIIPPQAGTASASVFDPGPGQPQTVQLQFLRNDGSPMADALVSHTIEATECSAGGTPPSATISYDPATQITDALGQITATVTPQGDIGDVVNVNFSTTSGASTKIPFPIVNNQGLAPCP